MNNTAEKLTGEIGVIPKSLQTFYRPDALMTVGAVMHGGGSASLNFCFPEYVRAKEDMGHVSSVQITAAILEGGYAALEDALNSKLLPPQATDTWFYSTLGDWLALRINVLFRRSLKCGEFGALKFRIIDIGTQRLRRRQLSATIEFDGFCSGETLWVISPPPGLNL